jgi:hypothetical protein
MKTLILALLLGFSTSAITAQAAADSTNSARSGNDARAVTLGNSVVALDGVWKFSPGDSPWENGTAAWAQPDFDDSHWAGMDMTPKAGSVDLGLGTSDYLPGWTRSGYPDLDGYAWYRLRVRVTGPVPGRDQPLWLKMPDNFDDAYQVYANGQLIGQFGDFRRNRVTMFPPQPCSFPLPSPGPDREIELAIRFYMSASTQFVSHGAGGMHGPPLLGWASAVRRMQASGVDAILHADFGHFLQTLIYLLVAPLALWAWLYNRRERAWLCLFLVIALVVVYQAVGLLADQTTLIPGGADFFWQTLLVAFLRLLWVMFWWEWFGLRERRWILQAAWLLAAAYYLARFCVQSPLMGFNFLPQPALHWFNTGYIWCGAALAALLVVILVEGFRRDRTEALLAALPVLLYLFYSFSTYFLTAFGIPGIFFPFGLGIGVNDIVYILMILVIGALAVRRFVLTQVRDEVKRKAIAQDLEQAQQLQQRVLVPEVIRSPHFAVETEYRPAQTVGGDFFQTLVRPDGSLLLVIGDVSGKGISAAMLVAVLVGAIRSTAEQSFDPEAMLAMLNRRLMGRSGGHFATCLAAEITPGGVMRIANAGHLPPFLNGNELELEGSLPLGLVGEIECTAQRFTLNPGDRLTFMTDGVVEATNLVGELFGFERTAAISTESAEKIAERAQQFGQEDDITVLTLRLEAAEVVHA